MEGNMPWSLSLLLDPKFLSDCNYSSVAACHIEGTQYTADPALLSEIKMPFCDYEGEELLQSSYVKSTKHSKMFSNDECPILISMALSCF